MKARLLLAALAAAALATGTGCAGDSGEARPSQADFPPTTRPPEDARYGGELVVLASGDVDYLDPGRSQYQFTHMITAATQRALMGWPPYESRRAVPDLAEERPRITEGGRRMTFTIRPGVRYSPPVGREVRAADLEYAIERGLLPGVANGYLPTYLSALTGFERAAAAAEADPTRAPDIPGVTATGPRTLELRFDRPAAWVAEQVLALPIGVPVPREYAEPFDAESPSTYASHLVATGPYMVEADESGEVTGYDPGREIRLVRNPSWDAGTDWRPAFVDRVQVLEGFVNTTAASRRIVTGSSQVNGDFPPDPPVLSEIATERPDQLAVTPSGGNLYVSLNTTIPPLDDPDVRRAVAAAMDREAMRLARGGEVAGPVATHFIPPGMPGFAEAGGVEGPGFPFLANPEGDLEVAKRYMRRAGYEDGLYDGGQELLMVADNSSVGRRTGQIAAEAFERLGIDLRVRNVSRDVMYTQFCNVPAAEVAACPNVGWLREFNDPQSMLYVPFSGDSIQPVSNLNLSQLDVPALNRAMDAAADLPRPAQRARAWAAIDRRVTGLAAAVPWLWSYFPQISSENVANVANLFNATTDLSYTSLTDAPRGRLACPGGGEDC